MTYTVRDANVILDFNREVLIKAGRKISLNVKKALEVFGLKELPSKSMSN